jgi:transposase
MVVAKERPISAVAKDLGISEPALRRWVKASTGPEDATAKRLAELENANDTVAVLKKSNQQQA